jgi:diacylglycerol kinase family enzyme
MHVLLVNNRGSGSADEIDPAVVLVDRGCVVTDIDIATAVRWGTHLPATLGSIERVVVAGGDGSIGVAAAIAVQLDVPLGVVPAGTANDFARSLELPSSMERACVMAVTGSSLRQVDLARLDGRPFLNVASIGLAPAAAEHAASLKRGIGALAYPVGAAWAAIRSRPVRVEARVDGRLAWTGPAWQAMIASTGAFGGWADVGTTRPGDGMLGLIVVPSGRGTRELVFDAAALTRGDLATRDGVHHDRGSIIEVTARSTSRAVVDGEIVDLVDHHFVVRVDERALRLVVG